MAYPCWLSLIICSPSSAKNVAQKTPFGPLPQSSCALIGWLGFPDANVAKGQRAGGRPAAPMCPRLARPNFGRGGNLLAYTFAFRPALQGSYFSSLRPAASARPAGLWRRCALCSTRPQASDVLLARDIAHTPRRAAAAFCCRRPSHRPRVVFGGAPAANATCRSPRRRKPLSRFKVKSPSNIDGTPLPNLAHGCSPDFAKPPR
jgi:hypothetical protein